MAGGGGRPENVEVAAGREAEENIVLPLGGSMETAEREIFRRTLEHTGGNKTRAARILGVSLKTMHNKVKKFEL